MRFTGFLPYLIFVVGVLPGTYSALADDRPRWILEHPIEDSIYRYFKGVGAPAQSPAEALTLAVEAARIRAIQECFGIHATSSTSILESEQDRTFTHSLVTQSRAVQLTGFERVQEWVHEFSRSSMYEAHVLFRFAKAEIERERSRQSSHPIENLEPSPWMTADAVRSSHLRAGTLKITSEPAHAEVWIDGVQWGTTPMSMVERLSEGPHQLSVQLASYESITRKVTVVAKQTLPVHIHLKRRHTPVRFESRFSGSTLEVVGYFKEQSPGKVHLLPEGVEVEVRIESPDAFPIVTRAIIPDRPSNEEAVVLNFDQVGKPSHFRLQCADPDVEISVDRRPLGKCRELLGREFSHPSGEVITVWAEKIERSPASQTVSLKPGQRHLLKFDQLAVVPKNDPELEISREIISRPWHTQSFGLDAHWTLGVSFGPTGFADTWSLPSWLELRLLNGLSLGYAYEFCVGPTYKGGGSSLYAKLHLSKNLYRGWFVLAETQSFAGAYYDRTRMDYLLNDSLPWSASGQGFAIGYENFPFTRSGDSLGLGYRAGFRNWEKMGSEFSGNVWMAIRF